MSIISTEVNDPIALWDFGRNIGVGDWGDWRVPLALLQALSPSVEMVFSYTVAGISAPLAALISVAAGLEINHNSRFVIDSLTSTLNM